MKYIEIEQYINDIPKFTSKNKPEHTKELMRRLGNPQDSFKSIHVAGSNGKGSTCSMIYSVLRKAGKTCGLFISPHLVQMRERVQLNGEICSEEAFEKAFDTVMEVVRQMGEDGLPHPTYFEIFYVIAMVVFAQAGVEFAVVETGLGGRLDATNSITKPEVCVITSISLEHTEWLGDTLSDIAGEKAGIIKEGVPVVFDAKHREVADVIFAKAKEKKAPVYPVYPGDVKIEARNHNSTTFVFDLFGLKDRVTIPFAADYQVENASLAMQALNILMDSENITNDDLLEGLRTTYWPARMEEVLAGVYVDGAHNVDGIRRLIPAITNLNADKPTLLFAMLAEKDYKHSIELLSTEVDWGTIVLTQIEGPKVLDVEIIEQEFKQRTEATIICIKEIPEAFAQAREYAAEGILICAGSLYLAGELKGIIGGKTNA